MASVDAFPLLAGSRNLSPVFGGRALANYWNLVQLTPSRSIDSCDEVCWSLKKSNAPESERRMRPDSKFVLWASLAALWCGVTGHGWTQALSSDRIDIRDVRTPSTRVCENTDVNAQVREALRLVCTQRASDDALASAQRLIVIGFLGGFAKDGDRNHPEVWFGTYLKERYPGAAEVSVISNHQRRRALADILRLVDADHDGFLTDAEKRQAKIIFYGHSWGASEAAAFARELGRSGIPVLLTIQIDIVPKPGQKPVLIPPNVEAAVNFFQSGGFLHGRTEVTAEDPGQTEIIGNLHMTYQGRRVDCRNYPWFARTFNRPHHEIENDARVWNEIGLVIDSRLSSLGSSLDQAAMR